MTLFLRFPHNGIYPQSAAFISSSLCFLCLRKRLPTTTRSHDANLRYGSRCLERYIRNWKTMEARAGWEIPSDVASLQITQLHFAARTFARSFSPAWLLLHGHPTILKFILLFHCNLSPQASCETIGCFYTRIGTKLSVKIRFNLEYDLSVPGELL